MTLLDLKTAAEMLGIHPETFRRRRTKGEFRRLEFYRVGGGALRVSKESVEKELEGSKVEDPLAR